MLIKLFHIIYLLFPTLYIVLGGSSKNYDLLLVLIVSVFMHWSFFRGECIMSYLEKKYEDPLYKLGHDKSSILFEDNQIIDSILMLTFVISGLYLTVKLKYNIPVYLFLS